MDRLCWILWILLMFPVIRSESSAESDCGFPGLPLDGSVEVYTVNRGYSTVTTQDWAPAKVGHYVFYRCAAQDLRVEYTQRTESRRCESGRWTQHVPICARKVNVDGDVFGINVKNNGENAILVDGNYDTCTAADAIQRETSFGLVFSRQYRIYGVKLIAKEQPGLHNVLWSLKASTEFQSEFATVEFHQKRLNSSGFFLIMGQETAESKWKSVLVTINSNMEGVQLCEIEIFALADQCGHPEIPLNGHVQWKSSDLTAIYNCNPGFQMDPYTPIRHCLRGTWIGQEPVCRPADIKCQIPADPIPVVFCVVLAVLLAIVLLIGAYFCYGYHLVKKDKLNLSVCGLHLYGRVATKETPPPVPPGRPLVEDGYEVPQQIYEEIKELRSQPPSVRSWSQRIGNLIS